MIVRHSPHIRRAEDSLIDAVEMAWDDLSIGMVNTLCACGRTQASAFRAVAAGRDAMLAMIEAEDRVHDRIARDAALASIQGRLADAR
ncbi:hypothetical protein [Pinisolibacter sp.]|uniref:hypothetical protein n=1 Tax=Pinisolibacter sp. TaxID=2172024 RepID=UPI002FDDE787